MPGWRLASRVYNSDIIQLAAVVVLARSTQEGIVVNLPSLKAEVPELEQLIAELTADADR